MTEREKWEAGLWYDANFDEELRIEREKAEERYTEFNQTRPSQKEKHKLLPGMAEDVVILPHFYTDYGYNCVIGAGSYLNHGAYLMDCAKITIGQHCFIGPGCGMYTAIHPILPQERNSGLELCKPITLGDNVWLGGDHSARSYHRFQYGHRGRERGGERHPLRCRRRGQPLQSGAPHYGGRQHLLPQRLNRQNKKAGPLNFQRSRFCLWKTLRYAPTIRRTAP